MLRGVRVWVCCAFAVAALAALAGCSHYFYSGEREAWRREAEVSCLNSGAVKDTPERVRISAISGPGMCGADFPIRVSALGESGPLSYDDEPPRPPAALPQNSMPQHWPVVQSNALPPPHAGAPSAAPPYGTRPTAPMQGRPSPAAPAQVGAMRSAASAGRPMSLYPPGVADPGEDDAAFEPEPPKPYDNFGARPNMPAGTAYPRQPNYPPANYPPRTYSPGTSAPSAVEERVPLGLPRDPGITASVGPVEVKPAATLACPIVAALDQWITTAVQPAALRWFRVPVVEIKQISAYSCRGMNGNPNAHISEHAFGNALDIAEFVLADGHRITVQYGWRGSPEEQGFLHDVQLAACNEFSTVLAPGANIYHYNHIHVDLMRRYSSRRICQPAAIPGEVVAEQARAQYAAHHDGDTGVTGSIKKRIKRALGYSAEDDDRLPLATPGED
jgi:hypothetical protein